MGRKSAIQAALQKKKKEKVPAKKVVPAKPEDK